MVRKKGTSSLDTAIRHTRSVILCAIICFVSGQFALAQSIESQTRLIEQEILNLLSGATLYGEYTDDRPGWAEQTAVTGQLFDGADNWKEVGRWTVIADMACYQYEEDAGLSCFDVYEVEEVYYFYAPGTDRLVAYTTRIDRPPMM